MIRAAIAAAMAVWLPTASLAAPLRHPALMVYYESWSGQAADTALATLPRSLDIVALAFARPDLRYPGGLNLNGTGLQFSSTGPALRDAIAALHRRSPATRVVLAVGGSAYTNWQALDADALARLVRDLQLDGVDVDFEPPDPRCKADGGTITCASDASWRDIVTRMRASLPRPALLTIPGWSVGAYGEGPWHDAQPHSPWTGSMLDLLKSPASRLIDALSVMAYDAGPRFDPAQALAAYGAAWPGQMLLGASVADGAEWVTRTRAPGGVMLYGWFAQPPPGQPGAAALARMLCLAWRPPCRE